MTPCFVRAARRYTHLHVPQVPDENSVHRMTRAAELPLPVNASGILLVLGDTTDNMPAPKHTIYQVTVMICTRTVAARNMGCAWFVIVINLTQIILRTQMGPDLYTLATALFDVNNCTVRLFTGNPLTSPIEHPSWPVSRCTPQE